MQDMFQSTRAGVEIPRVPVARRDFKIPVPPYDTELPEDYWKSLRTPKPRRRLNAGLVGLTCLVAGLTLAQLRQKPEPATPVSDVQQTQALPTPAPVPQTSVVVQRAQLLADPNITPPALLHPASEITWTPGTKYWVKMPDGRTLLVNFKGWVDHACNLPNFHGAPANNAMYFETATNHGWVYTLPLGANRPCWIDP